MGLELFYYAGVVIITGLFFGKLAKLFNLPNVTGYLVGGLLVGPSLLSLIGVNPLISEDAIETLALMKSLALGFIAFSIGNELKVSYFKQVGARPIIIAIFEALLGVLFVLAALLIFYAVTPVIDGGGLSKSNIEFSLVLSSIAAATAPAATLLVVRQYKAKGPLTETLLSVVALDDSVALILFGIFVAIANVIGNAGGTSTVTLIIRPFLEIFISLGVGGILGILLTLASKWFTGRGNRVSLVVAGVLLTSYLAKYLVGLTGGEGSPLLACMALGGVYANLYKKYDEVNGLIYFVTPPIFLMFFVISGAELDVTLLGDIGVIGALYVVFRVFGKIVGAWFGSKITKAEPTVSKYLGYSLLPQAGVAIGLSTIANEILPGSGPKILTIILCGTLIYEIIGPIVTKISLKAAGEIKADYKTAEAGGDEGD